MPAPHFFLYALTTFEVEPAVLAFRNVLREHPEVARVETERVETVGRDGPVEHHLHMTVYFLDEQGPIQDRELSEGLAQAHLEQLRQQRMTSTALRERLVVTPEPGCPMEHILFAAIDQLVAMDDGEASVIWQRSMERFATGRARLVLGRGLEQSENASRRLESQLAEVTNTTEGRTALAEAMARPIRDRIDYQGIARSVLQVQPLRGGALPIYGDVSQAIQDGRVQLPSDEDVQSFRTTLGAVDVAEVQRSLDPSPRYRQLMADAYQRIQAGGQVSGDHPDSVIVGVDMAMEYAPAIDEDYQDVDRAERERLQALGRLKEGVWVVHTNGKRAQIVKIIGPSQVVGQLPDGSRFTLSAKNVEQWTIEPEVVRSAYEHLLDD